MQAWLRCKLLQHQGLVCLAHGRMHAACALMLLGTDPPSHVFCRWLLQSLSHGVRNVAFGSFHMSSCKPLG